MSKIVFIPGLGADARLFSLLDISNPAVSFIRWQPPGAISNLQDYLKLVRQQVIMNGEQVILVGVSLGGILAMEWREQFPVKKTIIISSVKCIDEMPSYIRIFKKGNAYKLVKPSWLKKGASLVKPFISDVNNKPAMELFGGMLRDADEDFISWGIGQALHWERKNYNPADLVHIHGSRDHIFPLRKIKNPDYIIQGGTHDMIMSSAGQISEILRKELEGL